MELAATREAKIELLFTRHGDAWRLYADGWVAPYVRRYLDVNGEVFPVREPDLPTLERFMWNTDAPYVQKTTSVGGVLIEAENRSAIVIWEWLDALLSGQAT